MADAEADITRVAATIAAYVDLHPRAADTLEGVRQWWLDRESSHVTKELLSRALDQLVDNGELRRTVNSDGVVIYAAGDERD